MVIVVMGVSGSGKTAIGQALAERLGCPFYDGDDFHTPENRAKMANGIPLNDEDRTPWLARLHDLIHACLERGGSAVVACSALKRRYRDQLRDNNAGLRFVHLSGDFDLIWSRIEMRRDHFMKAEMLRSQFEALEIPTLEEALPIDITGGIEQITSQILEQVEKKN